ncbi:hypothetical protein U91I_01248 [alpha proteobacterium U9-1i]|nr:hypothetical protein U91I_01248 [alpha proteobacterium U9-1i]
MNHLSKRDILLALVALGVSAALPASAQTADYSAGRAIGEAYVEADPRADLNMARAALLPDGFHDGALPALKARVAADYRAGAVFNYRGWRLSYTEGQLFALLAQAR